METNLTIKDFFNKEQVVNKFKQVLGDNASTYILSVLQICNNNKLLQNVEPQSLYGAALTAAMLKLPVSNNFNYAYIIPYKNFAQLQISYKGLIQLALRTNMFKKINVTDVREGEIKEYNFAEGHKFAWVQTNRETKKTIGYYANFTLRNGFTAFIYSSVEEILQHANKYSISYKNRKEGNIWDTEFEAMAKKTVLKKLLKLYAPLSTELTTAIERDQAVILESDDSEEETQINYIDNEKQELNLTDLLTEIE